MQGAPGKSRTIRCASVPHVRVHHNNCSRLSGDQNFIWMAGQRIAENLLRQFSRPMGSGDASGCTIFERKIIKHPDGVADPVALLVRNRADVRMERLIRTGIGISRTEIDAAEFEVLAKDVGGEFQNARHHDGALKHFSLVDQVRKPPCVAFLLELRARGAAFLLEEFIDQVAKSVEEVGSDIVFEDYVAVAVKLLPFCVLQGTILQILLGIL